MLSLKQYEKKLREIQRLKQKQNHNIDEINKIKKENHYKKILNEIKGTTMLHILPDEVQICIMEFLDINSRLNLLRKKYTPEFINDKLSLLPLNKLTIKKLYSCIKYVINIITNYLDYNSENFRNIRCYIDDFKYDKNAYFLQHFIKLYKKDMCDYAIDLLKDVIIIGVKHYTKMYKKSNNIHEIHENEKNMIKLFININNF
jgi:hypothetical protein